MATITGICEQYAAVDRDHCARMHDITMRHYYDTADYDIPRFYAERTAAWAARDEAYRQISQLLSRLHRDSAGMTG